MGTSEVVAESLETEGVADCEPGWLDAKATNAQKGRRRVGGSRSIPKQRDSTVVVDQT